MLGFKTSIGQLGIHCFASRVMEQFLCLVLVSSYAVQWIQETSAYVFCVLAHSIFRPYVKGRFCCLQTL